MTGTLFASLLHTYFYSGDFTLRRKHHFHPNNNKFWTLRNKLCRQGSGGGMPFHNMWCVTWLILCRSWWSLSLSGQWPPPPDQIFSENLKSIRYWHLSSFLSSQRRRQPLLWFLLTRIITQLHLSHHPHQSHIMYNQVGSLRKLIWPGNTNTEK